MSEPGSTGHRQHRRTRRGWRWLFVAVLVVLVALVVDCAVGAAQARHEITAAESSAGALRAALAADHASVQPGLADRLADQAGAAHRHTSGLAWGVLDHVPLLGRPLRTVHTAAAQVDAVARGALPQLLGVERTLTAEGRRSAAGSVDLAALRSVVAPLDAADASVGAALHAVQASSAHNLLGPVDRDRARLVSLLAGLTGEVSTAQAAVTAAPTLLAENATRRYLLVFENEAESRGLGGIPAGFGVLTVTDGRLHLGLVRDNHAPSSTHPLTVPGVSPALLAQYAGDQPTQIFVNADLSPDFPTAARIWLALWAHSTGQHLDGVLATDPTTLAALLAVTGPVQVPGVGRIGADNAVSYLQSTIYASVSYRPARNELFAAVGRSALSAVLARLPGQLVGFARTLASAAGQRRLLLYSTDPVTEQLLTRYPLGGALPVTSAPFLDVTTNNAAGSKLDYYLHRAVTWTAASCTGPTRTSTVRVALSNAAPRVGLPAFVTIRADHHPPGIPIGQERLLVSVFITAGDGLVTATLNGHPSLVGSAVQAGHPVLTVDLTINPGATTILVLHLSGAAGRGAPLLQVQPGVSAQRSTIAVPACAG